MKNKLTEPKRLETICSNIRRIRNNKGISSKKMAYNIGMKPPEYSKLEAGHKLNLENWLDKIAVKLEVNKLDLMETENVKTYKSDYINSEVIKFITEQKEELFRLFKERDKKEINEQDNKSLDGQDKLKNELIEIYKEGTKYWKDKYYRIKAQLIKAEQRIEEFINKTPRLENEISFESGSSLGSVGGAF